MAGLEERTRSLVPFLKSAIERAQGVPEGGITGLVCEYRKDDNGGYIDLVIPNQGLEYMCRFFSEEGQDRFLVLVSSHRAKSKLLLNLKNRMESQGEVDKSKYVANRKIAPNGVYVKSTCRIKRYPDSTKQDNNLNQALFQYIIRELFRVCSLDSK